MEERPVILITGASSGFGYACAEKFAENNWDLIITGRRKERLVELQQDLEARFAVSIVVLHFDVRERAAVEAAVDSIPTSFKKRLQILINNAGLALDRSNIEFGNTDDWDTMIDTNVKGLLYVSKAVIPILKENQNTHIFNLASIAGKEVYPDGNVYCASKHAVDALSRAMRIDLIKYPIKVTNVAPGAADTEFSLVRYKGDQVMADKTYDGFTPLYAKDIAETIYFVATMPKHATINDLVIMPTAQASATIFNKNNV